MSERTFSRDLAGTLEWLRHEAERRDFAEITVVVKTHGGHVAHIERGVTEKMKPTGQTGVDRGRSS